MISRRTFIGTVGAVASCVVAGCSTADTESESDAYTQFEQRLTDSGINIIDGSYNENKNKTDIRYIPRQGNQNVLADEIGTIVGVFFQQVDNGWDVRRLEGTMLSSDESPIAEWFAKIEWYEQLQGNELTADELSIKVLDTLTSIESSP